MTPLQSPEVEPFMDEEEEEDPEVSMVAHQAMAMENNPEDRGGTAGLAC
jgi:hypothetical protein